MDKNNVVVGIDLGLRTSCFYIDKDNFFACTDIASLKKLDNVIYIDKKMQTHKAIDFNVDLLKCLIQQGYINFAIEDIVYSAGANKQWKDLYSVFRYVIRENNCNYVFLPHTAVKKFITGSGNADKSIIALSVLKEYGIDFSNYGNIANNIYDAFSVAKLGELFYRKINKRRIPRLTNDRKEILNRLIKTKDKMLVYINERKR